MDEIVDMVDMMIAAGDLRLKDRDMVIELTPAAKRLLAKRGFDPILGARPLRRTVQRDIEDAMAEKMLYGEVGPGQIVLVDVGDEESDTPFTFSGTPKAQLADVPDVPDVPVVETADKE
jgi:ATP-dependent Clp protease ATP-binding subunit ClpC